MHGVRLPAFKIEDSYKKELGTTLGFFDEDEIIVQLSNHSRIAKFQIETCIDYLYSWTEFKTNQIQIIPKIYIYSKKKIYRKLFNENRYSR